MFRATTHSLYRSPHVALPGHEVPPGGQELVSFDSSALIYRQGFSVAAVRQYLRPHDIAVSLDHCMSSAELMGFVGIQSCMNSAKNDIGAALAGQFSDFVPTQSVGGMDPDADHVAGVNLVR